MDIHFPEYITEYISEMVILFSSQGLIRYGNRAALEYCEYSDLSYVDINEIFPNLLQSLSVNSYLDIPEKETVSLMAYRSNKTCFRCEGSFCQQKKDGTIVGIFADMSTKDILEKRISQVQQEAEQALKVKSEFVANVTHELRTPVNGILGNTRIMLEEETDKENLKSLHLSERGCNDMNSIINNILDCSKLEAGKFTLEKRLFDFRGMIDYVKSNHMPKITEKGLQFFVTVSPGIPEHIIGDELRITQVLNNLLSNACKFTSAGKISLEVLKTAQTGNMVELFFMVVDTGIGIEKKDQDKLFKSFSQVDASISRQYGGTGLGLNISQQLIQLMNGNISVESEKNKGTSFSFAIWVEVPEDEVSSEIPVDSYKHTAEDEPVNEMFVFGRKENFEAITNNLSKLVLCIEMDNWEKAEMFVEGIRQLLKDAPSNIRTAMLKLKMAVQKGDYDASIDAHKVLMDLLN